MNLGANGNEVLRVNSDLSTTRLSVPSNPTYIKYQNNALYLSTSDYAAGKIWQLHKFSNSLTQTLYTDYDYYYYNANGFSFLDSDNVFLTSSDNNVVRKIDTASKKEFIIGNSRFGSEDGELSKASTEAPSGIVEDNQGNIYFSDNSGIRKITKQGVISKLYKTSNNPGYIILYNQKIYFVENSNLYSLELNGNIQKLATVNITGDNPSYGVNSLAVDTNGSIYVLMNRNNDSSSKYIRKYEQSGSYKDLNIAIQNSYEVRILVDQNNSLLVAYNGQIRRHQNENISTGTVVSSFFGYSPTLAINKAGEILISSRNESSFVVNVIKGDGSIENIINGPTDSSVNAGAKSGFSWVYGLLASSNGNVYISDSGNNTIRELKYSTSNSNSNSNVSLRAPRSNNSWSRPSGLLPGLSEVRYKGYFNNNTGYFSDSAEKTLITSTLSSRLPTWKLSNEMGTNTSMWWGGYFIPDETGVWDFQMTSDDAAFMWIGNTAVAAYGNGFANAFISLPGAHPAETKSNSISLKANQIYPFRIQYGNSIDVGSFALEVKPPSYKSAWDSNLEGLIWHSDFSDSEDCTNYGISYTLAAKLGYDIINVPNCKNNPAKVFASGINSGTPVRPIFNTFNVTGNTLNLNVNIGAGSNKPDKVFLIAPQLGIQLGDSASSGKISGNNATWAVPLTSAVLGKSIQLQFISNRDGVDSDPLVRSIAIPNSTTSKNKNQKPPLAATSPKYSVSGAKVILTAKIQPKVGANPMSGYLTAADIGITPENSILGKISGNQIIFTMPLLPSMMGKKTKTEIYMVNEMGESKPLSVTLAIAAPKQPTIVKPTQQVQTVICKKGIQTRTFAGKKCPPGWN